MKKVTIVGEDELNIPLHTIPSSSEKIWGFQEENGQIYIYQKYSNHCYVWVNAKNPTLFKECSPHLPTAIGHILQESHEVFRFDSLGECINYFEADGLEEIQDKMAYEIEDDGTDRSEQLESDFTKIKDKLHEKFQEAFEPITYTTSKKRPLQEVAIKQVLSAPMVRNYIDDTIAEVIDGVWLEMGLTYTESEE